MYALDGIKIVDFSAYIAGSYCGTLLADMGADVIKIEPPGGEAFRPMAGAFMGWNRGKRGIVVDMRTQEGKNVVYKMIESADVVLENFRPGVTKKLGIDYESAKKLKNDIVYVSVLGHGSSGPYSDFPGFDPLFQSRSGMMVGQGGLDNQPVFLSVAVNDYGAAMLGAYSAVLGLFVRARTGKGQHVESSLTNCAAAIQAVDFIDYEGKVHKNLGGVDTQGINATWRLYQTSDKWIFVLCAKEKHWRNLCKAIENEDLAKDPKFKTKKLRDQNDKALTTILTRIFKKKSADYWLEVLEKLEVPCAPQLQLDDVLEDQHWIINELWADHDHPELGRAKMTGLMPKLSKTPGRIWRPAPLLGQHTDQVLKELGYTEDEIADLREMNAIA